MEEAKRQEVFAEATKFAAGEFEAFVKLEDFEMWCLP